MSRKIRLGKRERALRKAQYAVVKSAKAELIAANLASLKDMPTSDGFRLSPNLKLGYRFNNPSNLKRVSRFGMDGTAYGVGGSKHK